MDRREFIIASGLAVAAPSALLARQRSFRLNAVGAETGRWSSLRSPYLTWVESKILGHWFDSKNRDLLFRAFTFIETKVGALPRPNAEEWHEICQIFRQYPLVRIVAYSEPCAFFKIGAWMRPNLVVKRFCPASMCKPLGYETRLQTVVLGHPQELPNIAPVREFFNACNVKRGRDPECS